MLDDSRPVCSIIPPHMLKEIAENGTPAQRTKAIQTLRISAQFRGQRQALAGMRALGPKSLVEGKERVVFSADYGKDLPGRQVRLESEPPTGDRAVDEAYDGAGATYDLYRDIYGRRSIDDKNLRLDSTVHYQLGYDNAFWNGLQVVYGDGDEDLPEEQRLFNRFTSAIDVIAHELTHGVTQFEASLIYWEQPGALNESFSDVFGSLVKQRTLGQKASEADWIIGQGLLTTNVNGVGIRSMKSPGSAYDDPVLGKDPQPAHMRDYKNVTYDNGGVHINSGIPNHAFFKTAIEIGGFAWEKAGWIWYITLRDKINPKAYFQDVAQATYSVAGELYGNGSLEQQAVKTGWQEVGIEVEGASQTGCLPAILRLVRLIQKPAQSGGIQT